MKRREKKEKKSVQSLEEEKREGPGKQTE